MRISLVLNSHKRKRRENLVVGMGGSDSKLNFRKAVVQLTTKKTVRELTTIYLYFYGVSVSSFFVQGSEWLTDVCFT